MKVLIGHILNNWTGEGKSVMARFRETHVLERTARKIMEAEAKDV